MKINVYLRNKTNCKLLIPLSVPSVSNEYSVG